MLPVACLLLAISPAAVACPLDSFTVTEGTIAWDALRVDAPLADVQKVLGHSLDLKTDPDRPGAHATILIGGRPIWLTFYEVDSIRKLSSIWIKRIERDHASCWTLESLVAAVKHVAPKARYVPSRHEPDEPEASNESPVYALDGRNELGVMLKPSESGIYVGYLGNLD